jgi:RNA polymerase sigma-70 factor, ECF subfamily
MPQEDVTKLLEEYARGDSNALDRLVPLVYDELRRLAANYMRRERDAHTLQPTALVHEAFVRMVLQTDPHWQSRAHFFGCAARIMRNLLVDAARARRAGKRGGGVVAITLDEGLRVAGERDVDVVRLDDALSALERVDPVRSRVVELRYFGGLTIEETASVLDVSPVTVKRHWTTARAWLYRELKGEPEL